MPIIWYVRWEWILDGNCESLDVFEAKEEWWYMSP